MNPARILVVEDEFIVAQEIEMRVAAMGYQVVESALNAQIALKLAEKHRPDLVLMDIHLQGEMDGIDAAQEIRRRFHLPVIFLTAYSEDTTLDRAKRAEPYGFILKPFEERELKSAIEIALYKHHAEREILRLNRLYDVLSQVNQAIVHANSRNDLLETICRIMVERSAIDLAWIGWLDPETARIHPVAHWGRHEALLSQAVFYADDRPAGQGNPGRAIRQGKPVLCSECIRGSCLYPAEFAPGQFGFNSCGSFPIHFQGRVCGTLNLGIDDAGFFQEREIELLKEVAFDISFALDKLEGDARRTQAEEALRKREEQYRLLVETANEGILAMDRDHGITYVNQAMAHMLGYEPSEMIGKTVEAYVCPGDELFHQERMKRRHAGEDEVYERRLRRRDGSSLWTLVSAKALQDDQGRFIGSFAMLTDITERKRAEESLRESEVRFRGYFELGLVGMAITSFEKGLVQVNDRLCDILGYSREELSRLTWAELTYPDDLEANVTQFDRVLRGEIDSYRLEKRFIRKDGEIIHALISAQCLRRADGQVDHFVAMVDDITERKNAEQEVSQKNLQLQEAVLELERARSMLQFVIESIPVRVFWKDRDSRFLGCNRLFARDAGFDHPQELVGRDDLAMVWRDQADLYRADDLQIMESGLPRLNIVEPQATPTGSKIWLNTSKVPLCLPDGEVFGVLGIYEDITDRKRAQEAERAASRYARSLIEASLDPLVTISPDGKITDVNAATETVTGYDRTHLIGTDFSDYFSEPEQARAGYKAVFEKGSVRDYPLEIQHRKGHVTSVLYNASLYRDEEGRIEGVFAVARDVTERKALESQLRHAQKLEAIGTLAGGIAHDFNNILSPIIGYTEMALDDIEESSSSRYDLDQVLTAANRAKDLVRQILSFSRLGEDQLMRPVEMSVIVKEALKLLRASLPSTIEIRQVLHEVTVVADATQLHQVVVNLCTNAAHAMEEMGVLDVSLLQVDLSAQDLVALSITDLRPGKHLHLSVKDTGKGMTRDTMQRIFDPYFTTKGVSKGTGLGLAVVHGIVKRHGGEILVKSEVGKGSTFDVYLPAAESTLTHEGTGSQALPKGGERILLVDDESAIAEMEGRILEKLGYKVTAMTSPMEALDLFRSQPDQFDLIITDYTMPQMVGTELANECKRLRAEIPVIICTGYSERLNNEEPDQPGAQAVAIKPLNRKQLAMLVRDVLDKVTG